MRMMLHISFPHDSFNAAVKDGTAGVEFRVVMSPDDLQKAGLDELGKKWS
jgi:hypothetical protein